MMKDWYEKSIKGSAVLLPSFRRGPNTLAHVEGDPDVIALGDVGPVYGPPGAKQVNIPRQGDCGAVDKSGRGCSRDGRKGPVVPKGLTLTTPTHLRPPVYRRKRERVLSQL